MLRELCELAEREELVGDAAFDMRPVAWIITLKGDGTFLGWNGTHEPEVLPEGSRRRPKEFAKKFMIPRQFNPLTGGTRSSGDYAYFLVDKSDYVLGCVPDGKAKQPPTDKKLINRLKLFTEKVQACFEATSYEPLKAVIAFLQGVMQNGIPEDLPKKSAAGDNFAFMVRPERSSLIHQSEEVMKYWRAQCRKTASDGDALNCLITGEPISLPSLFPMVKRVPGAQAQAGLVSFNSTAFESYGWKTNANAPVSAEAGQAASVALNRLLDPAFVRQDGKVLPRLNKRMGEDTVVCYWAKDKTMEGLTANLSAVLEAENDPQKMDKLWRGVYDGKVPEEFAASRFYLVTLAGAQGRVMVRDYLDTSAREAQESVAEYFKQLQLSPNTPPAKGKLIPGNYSLRLLRECLTHTGKADDLPGTLGAALFTCAVNQRRRFPDALLPMALERMRAESSRDDWIDSVRRDARTALIKAILIRNHDKPNTPIMSNKDDQPGYLLGRLFACIERMQYLALGADLNKNIAARYFAAASTNPLHVFITLKKALVSHYEPKAMRKNGGACVLTKREVADIETALDKATGPNGIQPRLDLVQQGLFAIGYHVQRGQYLNWKRDAAEKANAESTDE